MFSSYEGDVTPAGTPHRGIPRVIYPLLWCVTMSSSGMTGVS